MQAHKQAFQTIAGQRSVAREMAPHAVLDWQQIVFEEALMALVYEGYYTTLRTVDKTQGGILLGADCIVGDRCSIQFKTDEGKATAWVYNRFGGEMGYLDAASTRRQQLAEARGLTTIAFLASVYYVDAPESGYYGAELAILHIAPAESGVFEPFATFVGEKLADGMRPHIDLSEPEISNLLANPTWRSPVAPLSGAPVEGAVSLKAHETLTEKIVEQGRKKNPGCYIASIVILAAVAYLIVRFALGLFA